MAFGKEDCFDMYKDLLQSKPDFEYWIEELEEIDELGCNCGDMDSCHGHVIVKLYS